MSDTLLEISCLSQPFSSSLYKNNSWVGGSSGSSTSLLTRQMWGDPETITEKLSKRPLEWLGHLVRMED